MQQPMSKMVKYGKNHENIIEQAMKKSDRWQNLADDGLSDKEIKASFYVKNTHESICLEPEPGKRYGDDPL